MATKNNNYNVDSITRINSPLKRNGGGFIGQSTDIDWQDIQSEFGDELNSVRIITELEKLKDLNLEDLANKLERLWTWYQNSGGGTTPVIYPTRDNTHLLVDEANAMVSVIFDEPNTQYDTIEWSVNNSNISIEASNQTPTIANITNRSTAQIRCTITCKINFNNTYLELTANASISGGGGIITYPTSSNTYLRVDKENNTATVNVIIGAGVSYDSIEWSLYSNQDDNIITLDKSNNNRTCLATNISQSQQTIRIQCKIYYAGNTSNPRSLSLRTSEIELTAGAQNIPSFQLAYNTTSSQISINPTNFDLNSVSSISWSVAGQYHNDIAITTSSNPDPQPKVKIYKTTPPHATSYNIVCEITFSDNSKINNSITLDVVKITFTDGNNTYDFYYFKGQKFDQNDLILENYKYTFNYNNNSQYRTWTKKIDNSSITISTNTNATYNISIISSWDNNTLPTVDGLDNGLYVVWTDNNVKLTSLPNVVTSNKTYTGIKYSEVSGITVSFSTNIYDYIDNNVNQCANININESSAYITATLMGYGTNPEFENKEINWTLNNNNIILRNNTTNSGDSNIISTNQTGSTIITVNYGNNINKIIYLKVKDYINITDIENLSSPDATLGTQGNPAKYNDIITLKANTDNNPQGNNGYISWNKTSYGVFEKHNSSNSADNPIKYICTWNSSTNPNIVDAIINAEVCDDQTNRVISSRTIQLYAQTPQTPSTTYYWYAGQIDPSTMTSISPIATDYNNGGGWYELGTAVPETITQLVKGGDSSKYWYVAVPITSGTTLKPVASDMTTLDTSVTAQGTKSFNGITYQIYWCGGATAARNTFRYAKK